MNLNKISKLCKKNRQINIYDVLDENGNIDFQCVGNRYAFYALHGIGFLNETNIYTLFNIPFNTGNGYTVRHTNIPVYLPTAYDPEERPLKIPQVNLIQDARYGKIISLINTEHRAILINNEYYDPLDMSIYAYNIYSRVVAENKPPYIAVYDGMIFQAYIAPIMPGEETIRDMTELGAAIKNIIYYNEEGSFD